MPQVRAIKTFRASRYGYMVRAGVIFSAETDYARDLAHMGLVEILPDEPLNKAARPPVGKDPPPGSAQPAPAPSKQQQNSKSGTADPTDDGLVKVLPSSRPARASPKATANLRVDYPTEPS
jgi:hypothetical protein